MTAMTTMKVPVGIRDRLMALAQGHDRTLGAELAVLVAEAEEREWWRRAKQSTARLRADPGQWADYLAETGVWDTLTADGLPDPADEWPEYQQGRP